VPGALFPHGANPGAHPPAHSSTGSSAVNLRINELVGYRPGAVTYDNHVHRIVPDANLHFDALPLDGQCSRRPWSGDYWAAMNGGPAYRWRTGEKHTYALKSKAEIEAMAPVERREFLNALSPAEKYDLLCGNFDYPFTQQMLAANRASTPSWQGYCHGWTMASIHFPEPQPVDVISPDGLELHFGSSDVKALLTFLQGEVVRTRYNAEFTKRTDTLGNTNPGARPDDPRAFDANPGSFHALLGNLIGMKDQAFGIDCVQGRQKWNQPLHGYRSEVLGEIPPDGRSSPQAVKQMLMRTEVTYALEAHPSDEPHLGTPTQSDRTETYFYSVELDADGKICGGQWMCQMDDGRMFTYHEVLSALRDAKGLSGEPLKEAMEKLFRFPDYAYLQEKADLAPLDRFRQAQGPYEFLANDKKKMWLYLAKLGLLTNPS
jgi:hypothetical protein